MRIWPDFADRAFLVEHHDSTWRHERLRAFDRMGVAYWRAADRANADEITPGAPCDTVWMFRLARDGS